MFTSIPETIKAIENGQIAVVADDKDRENEGDLILAAETVTTDKIAFMVRYSSGVICTPITEERRRELKIPMMVEHNEDPKGTAYTVSVDAKHGTTTGISASDRAKTIFALSNQQAQASSFSRPGHVFPLVAQTGGVISRPGHTEAGLDLSRLAGLSPASAICELVNDDGSMMRAAQLAKFARRHKLPFATIEDLVTHRLRTESWIHPTKETMVKTPFGLFFKLEFHDRYSGLTHVVLWKGPSPSLPIIRIQHECTATNELTGLVCDCAKNTSKTLQAIARAGSGCLIRPGHPGNTAHEPLNCAANKVKEIDFGVARQILSHLEIRAGSLLHANEKKFPDSSENLKIEIIKSQNPYPQIINPRNATPTHINTNILEAG